MAGRIFIVTGDYSGDRHAADVVREILKINPETVIEGVGGINLEKTGIKLLFNQDKMNTMGITPITIINHIKMGKAIVDYLKTYKPDLVLLIDYGAFNLQLSKALKKEGTKTFYFIPPQVWASRKWRIKTIKENIDKVFTIFPFEKEFYEKEGIKTVYAGHPLVRELPPKTEKAEFYKRHGLSPDKKLIGVFPGSRIFEIKFLFKIFENAVSLIEKALPDVQFIFSQSENLPENVYKTKYPVLRGENYALLSASDALILASGTVALEAALYQTPMIIAYKGPFLFYLIYLLVRTIDKACLVNIITQNDVVPEFLMYNATSKKISDAIIKLVTDENEREKQIRGFEEVKKILGETECAGIVAKEIIKEVENG